MNKISILILCLFVGFFMSCASGGSDEGTNKEGTELAGDIKIDGSSTVYPITEAIAEEYRAEAPKVKVTIGVSGTGGGFKKFGRGETDISNASRSIKDKEAEACKANNMNYVQLSVAYDGIAVVGHPENDWVDNMTTEQLKKIWEPESQGTVTNWNQIDPSFPDHKMNLLGPGTASGTFDYFTKAIVGKSGSSRGDYMPSEDDHVLVQGVSGDKYALGFFGLAYYEENKDKLKLIGVDAGEGAVTPTIETVANGSYKPLSRPIFIYVSSAAVKKPQVVDFVKFYLTNAKEIAADVGYIPMLDNEYEAELQKFKEFLNANK